MTNYRFVQSAPSRTRPSPVTLPVPSAKRKKRREVLAEVRKRRALAYRSMQKRATAFERGEN